MAKKENENENKSEPKTLPKKEHGAESKQSKDVRKAPVKISLNPPTLQKFSNITSEALNLVDPRLRAQVATFLSNKERQLEDAIQKMNPKPLPPPIEELRLLKANMTEDERNMHFMAWIYVINNIPANSNMKELSKITMALAEEDMDLNFLTAIEILLNKKGNEINKTLVNHGKTSVAIPSLLPNIRDAIQNVQSENFAHKPGNK